MIMRKLLLRFFLLCIGICCMTILQAQENFASPIVIGQINPLQPHYVNSQNSCAYTNDIANPSADVVYQFSVADSYPVTISMCGSSYDTYIWLYDSGFNYVGSDDDGCIDLSSTLTQTLTAGTYYIVCEGYSSNCGNYTLDVYANPIYAGNLNVCGLPHYIDSKNTCDFANDVADVSKDVIYSFTLGSTQSVTMSLCNGTNYDSFLYLYNSAFAQIASSDDACGASSRIIQTLNAGTYYLVVEGYGSYCGTYTLDLAVTDLPPVLDAGILPDLIDGCSITSLTAPTATDVCAGIITGVPNVTLPITASATITWTFNDGGGNVITQNQNVIINDAIPPVPDQSGFTINIYGAGAWADETTWRMEDVANSIVASGGPYSGNYASGVLIQTIPGIPSMNGPYTFFVETTGPMNDNSITYEILCNSVIVSSGNIPAAQTLSFGSIMGNNLPAITATCSIIPVAPTATDNCSGTVTGSPSHSFPLSGNGTTIVTWTYTDGNGNSSAQTQSFTISDTEVPTITCPPDLTINSEDLTCEGLLLEPTVYDIPFSQLTGMTSGAWCGISPIEALTCSGTIGFSWNSIGTTTPVIVSVEFYQGYNDNGSPLPLTLNGIADANYAGPISTCVANLYTLNLNPSSINVGGVNSVQFATPNCVLFGTNPNPAWAAGSFIRVTELYNAVDLGTPVVSDNCNIASVTNDAAASYPVGANNITWTVADYAGNTASCVQTLTVLDVTAPVPVIPVLADITAECEVFFLIAPTATDNCGTVTVTNDVVFPINAQGTTVVTWTYDDGNGNTSTQLQNVVIDDVTAPVPNMPVLADITAECEVLSIVAPIATDNCGGLVAVTNNAVFPINAQGTTVVTWTYDDGNGNTSTQTQNVVIDDITNPTITCPTDLTINANASCDGLGNETIVYDIPITQLVGMTPNAAGCTALDAYYCGGIGGPSWVSTGSTIPESVSVQFYQIYNDGVPSLSVDFNGNADNFYNGPNSSCVPQLVTLNLNPLNYNVGALNTVLVASANCFVLAENPDPSWTPGSFARVTVVYTTLDLGTPVVADNCSVASVTNNSLPTYPLGTHTIQWTVTDLGGNTATCNQQLTVVDATAPVPFVPVLADVTAECQVLSLVAPTATDNCGTVTVTNDVVIPITSQGSYLVTWTYDDGNGNTSTQTQNVVIDDITAPVPDLVSLPDLTDACSIASLTAPTATDNCMGSVTVTHDAVLPIMGTSTITWSYDDGNGNISTQTQQVIINDLIAPIPDLLVLADITAECEVASLTAPTGTDNCGGPVTVTHDAILPIYTQGTTVVTWTFADANMNTSTLTQNVVLTDVTAPIADIPVLADVTAECEVSWIAGPTATDNCGGFVTVTNDAIYPINTQGTTVVTWTYDDGNGNTSTQTQNVVIDDITPPNPDMFFLDDVVAQCEVNYLTAPTATDNCGGLVTVTRDVVIPISTQGTTVVTWTYEDQYGNTSTQTQNVVIDDTQAPVPDISGFQIQIIADNNVSDDFSWNLVDASSTVVASGGPYTNFHNGQVLQMINNLNAENGPYTFNGWGLGTFFDNDWSFEIYCNSSLVASESYSDSETASYSGILGCNSQLDILTDDCSITSLTAPTATDDCSSTVTVSHDAVLPITGTSTITWSFDDGNGNISTQTQQVIINDIVAPVLDLPVLADITAECEVTSFVYPTATDACGGLVTVTHDAILPITAQGTTVVTWTFADANMNSVTQTQNVILTDITAPVADIPVLADVTAECEVTMLMDPTATDNCGGFVTVTNDAVLPYIAQGSTVITWTYEDVNGNISTQTQNIVIDDISGPVADMPILADVTAECVVTTLVEPTATDNCGGLVVVTNDATLPITAQGTTVVTWTYEDVEGNTTTQTQNVVLNDITFPVADAISLSDLIADCEITSWVEPTATDNCVGTITGMANVSLPVQSTTTITWSFEDANGNITTQTQEVIINDFTVPVLDAVSLADITGDCEVISLVEPTATDNCMGTINGIHDAVLPITAQGTTVVTWTFTDGNGNFVTQTQNVVLEDLIAPVADVADLDEVVECFELAVLIEPTATDNCNGTVTVTHNATLPITTSTTITWTYEDVNGNTSTQTQSIVINTVDVSVTDASPVLTANATGASYQWVDCDNANAPIAGETNQSFTATANGNYAVEVTQNGCTDLSDCISVTNVGIEAEISVFEVDVYPNPTTSVLFVQLTNDGETTWKLTNVTGQVVLEGVNYEDIFQLDLSEYAPGVYMLNIQQNDNVINKRVVRK